MIVRNKSSKIIGINETSILPGDTQKVPDGYEKNPVVLKYIENGTFTVVEPVKSAKKEKTKKDPAEGTKKDPAEGTKKDPAEGTKKADDPQKAAEPDAEGAQGQQAGT